MGAIIPRPNGYDFDADRRTRQDDAVPLAQYAGEVSGLLWTLVAGQPAYGPSTSGRVVAQGRTRKHYGLRTIWFHAGMLRPESDRP